MNFQAENNRSLIEGKTLGLNSRATGETEIRLKERSNYEKRKETRRAKNAVCLKQSERWQRSPIQ